MRQFGNFIYDSGTQTLTPEEDSDPALFDEMPLDKFAAIVNRAALGNAELYNQNLSKADSFSFQVAHPEFMRTPKNTKLINHWLSSQRITNPTYPDFAAAYECLTAEGLLDIDKAELAKQQDQRGNRTFKGAISGQTYDSLDSMIAQERIAAVSKTEATTKEEQAFEKLPIEQQQALLRSGERAEQLQANGLKTQKNGDAWITLHPEYVDSDTNARKMKMQLKANGISDNNASIEDYEIAAQQLRESGLLTLNKTALAKQHAAEVKQLATEAAQAPGSVFDNTTEEEMYKLPLEEVRRRAMGIF